MSRFLLASFLVVAVAITIAGCGTFSPEGNGGSDKNQLADYGGYTTANEDPGFGDPALIAGHRGDTPFDDEMANNPEVSAAARNGWAKFYMLRMVWGNIDNPDTSEDSGPCGVTDWSGSLKVNGGIVIVTRLIRFEHDDYIVRPRHGLREIQWVSHTRNSVDGLLVEVIDVPDPRNTQATDSITITTPFGTVSIPFDSLATLNVVNTYDDCNKLSLVGAERLRVVCPRGFLEGTWVSESDTSGSFQGAWIGEDGVLAGYLRGHYGFSDTKRVLFGKWITTSGAFGGLLNGTWGTLVDDHHGGHRPDGYFEGKWVDDGLTEAGLFSGRYSLPAASDSGTFHGRWIKECR